MGRLKHWAGGFFVAACMVVQLCSANRLPAAVSDVMQARKIPRDAVSIYIHELGQRQPLVAFNATQPRQPASTIKLLTTYAALEILGPTFSWKTSAHILGKLSRGRSSQGLVIKGFGDPFFTNERFWAFVSQLRNRGLSEIDGEFVIDNSYFMLPKATAGAFDGQAQRAYNALPSALMLNFQAIELQFQPNAGGSNVAIFANPNPANLRILNHIKYSSGKCKRRNLRFSVSPEPRGSVLAVTGRYPIGCGESSFHRLLMAPDQMVYGVFQTLWRQLGGSFSARLSNRAPADLGKPLFVYRSPPLAELIRGMNKYSNNVMTRHLLLTLGAEQFGPPATLEKGRKAIDDWLADKGLHFPELVVDNGAGLSRTTSVAARSFGHLLIAAARSQYAPELQASMPLAGMDGTLRRRFVGEGLAGNARMKTGSLNNVRALAGYVNSASGRRFAVVIFQNKPGLVSSAAVRVENALLRWIYSQ